MGSGEERGQMLDSAKPWNNRCGCESGSSSSSGGVGMWRGSAGGAVAGWQDETAIVQGGIGVAYRGGSLRRERGRRLTRLVTVSVALAVCLGRQDDVATLKTVLRRERGRELQLYRRQRRRRLGYAACFRRQR